MEQFFSQQSPTQTAQSKNCNVATLSVSVNSTRRGSSINYFFTHSVIINSFYEIADGYTNRREYVYNVYGDTRRKRVTDSDRRVDIIIIYIMDIE